MATSSILLAGEAHLGAVGGEIGIVSASPTVQAAAYASGNVLGGLLTFTGIARAADKSFTVQSVVLQSKAVQSAAIDLVLFNANPTGSTTTDKAAVAIVAADYAKAVAKIALTDWTSLGTASFAQAGGLTLPLLPVSGTANLFGLLIARGAITPASTSDLTVLLRAARD